MPRINSDEVTTYGTGPQDQRLMFRERLMNRFAAHDWVRVINIDDETFKWQYLPAHSEEFEFTPDPMKITRRGEVEVYALEPGESEVIIGECAYIMIEALYKKLVAKKVVSKNPDAPATTARNFNWTDGVSQEEFINRIYLGKESPSFKTVPKVKENVIEHPTLPPKLPGAIKSRRIRPQS